jgi:hypothetical protein
MSNSTPLICTSAHLMITDWQICRLLLTSAEDNVKKKNSNTCTQDAQEILSEKKMYDKSLICDNCHNSKFVIFQEKLLEVLKCYNFLCV